MFAFILFSAWCGLVLSRELGSFEAVHLITQYYHDRNTTRHLEYDYALCMNLKNPAIGAIHLLQSPNLAMRPVAEEELYDFCKPEWAVPDEAYGKVVIHTSSDISDRLKFGQAVSYAIRNAYNELVIIANSDIYFDESLSVLVDNPYIFYDLRMMRKNYWLSRYEKDESANLGTQCGPKFRGTHDAFVFCPTADHEFLIEKSQFMLGTWGLANRVIYELRERGRIILFAGLRLFLPSPL